MPGSRYLFLLIALSVSLVQSWDVALTVKDRLEFYSDQNKIDTEKSQFGDLSALTYDAAHNILFFADKPSDNASIVSFNLTTRKYQPLVRRKPKDNIQAVAFDPVQGLLFWTDTIEKSIYYMSLTSRSQANFYGNLFIKMDDEIPTGIAIDSCRGYVYWTNKNITKPTIERARFDGTERTVIVETNIFMPVSIAIDQQTKRLYWVDDKEGIHYSIESSDLNGKDRMTLLTGAYHTPNYITVAKDSIFWVDVDSGTVWTIPKTVTKNTEPNKYVTLNNEVPFGIVANYNIEDQIKNSPECEILTHHKENKTSIKESFTPLPDVDLFCVHGVKVIGKLACNCTAGYTGERCDVSVCNNYCYSGDCTFTTEGQPTCSCNVGYVGKRCEINICYNYCLNHGVCKINEKNQPICSCSAIFEGSRCENVKPIPTTTPLLTTVRATEKTHSLPETEVVCNCKNEVAGKTREPELCYNYCLNNGTCELNEKDEPTCSCSIDFEGSRCEDIKVIPSSMSSRTTMRTTEETQSLPETEVTCNCKEGPAGKTREIEKCYNYCLNDGSCEISDKYEPICSCSIDFEGSRCENVKHIPTSKSATKETQLLPETEVTCNCTKEENASAIQSSYNSVDKYEYVGENSCNDDWNSFSHPAFIVLSISCGALCVICVFLITKIMQLKKRPRIKKRIIVNKNVTPLTARPDQCEITIENCCNMNICETPCFEPRSTIRPTLINSKPRKEEKKNLIANMDCPDDY